jgi:hypothetical protein
LATPLKTLTCINLKHVLNMYIISKQVKEPAADNRRLPRPTGDSTVDRKKPGAKFHARHEVQTCLRSSK